MNTKTPREILLARHCAAEPTLDAMRRKVIAEELNNKGTKEQRGNDVWWILRYLTAPWRELILPTRRIWAGLAAVWLLLLAVNFSQRDNISCVTGQPVRSAPVMMSWQAQQRLMSEVLADRAMSPEVDRPRNLAPKPRTENGKFSMS